MNAPLRSRLDVLIQVVIPVLSLAAIALLAEQDKDVARWGWVVGLASQPLWIAATWRARQWGIFILSLAYLVLWVNGILHNF